MLRGIRLAAVAAALVPLLLSGCSTEPQAAPPASAVPSVTATPAFATKEEAFAAAEKVYRRYLKISGSVLAEPDNAKTSDFASVLEGVALSDESSTIAQARENGLRLRGSQRLEYFQGQAADLQAGVIDAYVCVDFSKARVVNDAGKDVTPSDRAVTGSSVAHFRLNGRDLLVYRETEYSGHALC